MKDRLAEASKHIRDGVQVVVHKETLASAGDAKRPDTTVMATLDGKPITWGEVKDRIIAAGQGAVKLDPLAMEDDARMPALLAEIDVRIMAQKARAAGLDQDRIYQVRVKEYRKSHLINLHRDRLLPGRNRARRISGRTTRRTRRASFSPKRARSKSWS